MHAAEVPKTVVFSVISRTNVWSFKGLLKSMILPEVIVIDYALEKLSDNIVIPLFRSN